MLMTYRLDFGPDFKRGIVGFEPPHVGKPYVGLVPAVDEDGNVRAGIRMPAVEVPIATFTGWNYRAAELGSADQFLGEAGSIFPFAAMKIKKSGGDSRLSMEERYSGRDQYVGKVMLAARRLIGERFMLAEDLPDAIDEAVAQYDWAARIR
jgi:hypothetical protein